MVFSWFWQVSVDIYVIEIDSTVFFHLCICLHLLSLCLLSIRHMNSVPSFWSIYIWSNTDCFFWLVLYTYTGCFSGKVLKTVYCYSNRIRNFPVSIVVILFGFLLCLVEYLVLVIFGYWYLFLLCIWWIDMWPRECWDSNCLPLEK